MVALDRIICGDCLEELPTLPEDSIDAIVTDPPAGISFMGKEWDKDKGGRNAWIAWMSQVASECLRVIKPGGHALVWALPRTSHWTGMAWEEAGWEPRDKISHVFGSGFPKSLSIDKAIDKTNGRVYYPEFKTFLNDARLKLGYSHLKVNELMESALTGGGFSSSVMGDKQFNELPTVEMYSKLKKILNLDDRFDALIERAEAEREVIGKGHRIRLESTVDICGRSYGDYDITAPATPAAKQWAGWGSAIKPAHEDWWLFRKPLSEKTIAENVLRHGVGGLNIDGCRVGYTSDSDKASAIPGGRITTKVGAFAGRSQEGKDAELDRDQWKEKMNGRFPANLIWSHSPNCKRIGTKKVKGNAHYSYKPTNDGVYKLGLGQLDDLGNPLAGADGLEEVESWDCDPSCPSWQFAKAGERKVGFFNEHRNLPKTKNDYGSFDLQDERPTRGESTGSAARFFQACPFTEDDIPAFLYYAKASRSERGEGNNHPTVKSLSLMRYLCRLITPPGGLILDPFAGSGTTCMAAKAEGFHYLGIEREAEYAEIARRRIAAIPTGINRWEEDARP